MRFLELDEHGQRNCVLFTGLGLIMALGLMIVGYRAQAPGLLIYGPLLGLGHVSVLFGWLWVLPVYWFSLRAFFNLSLLLGVSVMGGNAAGEVTCIFLLFLVFQRRLAINVFEAYE